MVSGFPFDDEPCGDAPEGALGGTPGRRPGEELRDRPGRARARRRQDAAPPEAAGA
ncbi:hypothetical protein AB0O05_19960 [Streptomyces sp. NPDC093084]|uniref:hypothetical protein n=1 Tax=Streptomyces sp. NPDC093084 TaxID=3155197 RepID=UPI003423C50D